MTMAEEFYSVNKLIKSSIVVFDTNSELVSVNFYLNRFILIIVAYNLDRLNLTKINAFLLI